jgi:hypothetical protein
MDATVTPFLWVLVGAWIGAPVGFFAAALCQAAARGDAHLDPVSRRQAAEEVTEALARCKAENERLRTAIAKAKGEQP